MKISAYSQALLARVAAFALACAVVTPDAFGQLIYQEGFNDDGETNVPPRYTVTGRDVFEVARIQSELANFDQKGPIFFAHNFDVSYVGNPAIPARRAIWTPRGVDTSIYTEDLLKLWDSTVDWLLQGKANATIVVFPDETAIQGLADRLKSRGHTVVPDDSTTYPDEQDVPGDLFIHASTANPSRFVMVKKPVIVMSEPDYDDMLVGSIGALVNFTPGQVTIAAAGHPAAGGKTGTFDGFTGAQDFGQVGTFLPTNATVLATVTQTVPPGINNLLDVDAVIAGTKQHDQSSGTVTDLDLSDGSSGSWSTDNAIPGGYTGNWGLRVQGKLTVSAAGEYRFALGSDKGARLQIDLDKNGFTAADTVLEDPGPHTPHANVYVNVVLAAGDYDFEVRSYNSSGVGDLEVSVANVPVPVPDDALDSGYWELLSQSGASAVKLKAPADVTSYVATGPDVQVQTPVAVLLNGPTDTPPGVFFDGGPFGGYEGAGFFGASGLNKFPGTTPRTVRLNPVNVAGKTNVQLTIGLAATVVDFETSDFLDVIVYTNGVSSNPTTLAHFQGVVNAIQPWMADQKANFVRRLTRQFADFTYNVPAGATDLVVEISVSTTWWTEIAAFDNIRITAGTTATPPITLSATAGGDNINLTWTGGTPPYLVQGKLELDDASWIDLQTLAGTSTSIPLAAPGGVFRVQDGTTKTVKLFRAALNGANERPDPNTQPGTGIGLLALDGLNATYVVSYQKLSAVASAAHLHGLATADLSANVLFPLVGTFGTSGLFVGSATVASQAIADGIAQSMTYFNIHTPGTFAGGEIRGQVVPVP